MRRPSGLPYWYWCGRALRTFYTPDSQQSTLGMPLAQGKAGMTADGIDRVATGRPSSRRRRVAAAADSSRHVLHHACHVASKKSAQARWTRANHCWGSQHRHLTSPHHRSRPDPGSQRFFLTRLDFASASLSSAVPSSGDGNSRNTGSLHANTDRRCSEPNQSHMSNRKCTRWKGWRRTQARPACFLGSPHPGRHNQPLSGNRFQ